MASGRKGLGRGLSALMADVRTEEAAPQGSTRRTGAERMVPIEKIHPNPAQPRRHFDEVELEELATSIREFGIIQPLVVRAVDDVFELVAGERRWRAAQLAERHEVPVVVRDYDELEVLQIGIVENVQRADLNPIDEASAYHTLIERYGHSQDQVADAVGKSRSHVANLVRLLALPDPVREMLVDGRLSTGHARALIGLPNAVELAERAVKKGLSVREVERLATAAKPASSRKPRAAPAKDADTLALEGDLSATLKMPVQINHRAGSEGGVLSISYASLDDLDRLCQALSGVKGNIFSD
ncbi:ParB/RepB/Spo0J family partition protein [Frigidibacter sp. ROC022]|uniref:ParB/RepB/Spo0J family partition protein n=1 Tax=Frigidibacter sp. ROC022 TaxID=2971796 RepID=UPI00215ABEFD|nr:ParB/RepB/Spo0J family partition protein [Frigidibacter sp. ROC022]MCR8724467.1 ParB/RepB/Spo0J family partition protein [Frigidibacter sp. ROC022]